MQNYQKTIEALYQVLPAESMKDIVTRLRGHGVFLSVPDLRNALNYLRKHSETYGFTVPYAGGPGSYKFYATLLEKDGVFHSDPEYKSSLNSGSRKTSKSIITYTTHVSRALRSASCATHIPRSLREDFVYFAEKYDQIARDIKRLYRKLDEFEADGTNRA